MRPAGRSGMLEQMTVRALIVDDNRQFLRAAREMLEREGINVVAIASTGAQALRSAGEHDPDVVLLDVGLGDESGFDVAVQLTAAASRPRRVVLISARSEEDLQDLIEESPAIGFVAKSRLSAAAVLALLGLGNGSGPSRL
jgi:two-component system nitrate/nitrite response regulator NarL